MNSSFRLLKRWGPRSEAILGPSVPAGCGCAWWTVSDVCHSLILLYLNSWTHLTSFNHNLCPPLSFSFSFVIYWLGFLTPLKEESYIQLLKTNPLCVNFFRLVALLLECWKKKQKSRAKKKKKNSKSDTSMGFFMLFTPLSLKCHKSTIIPSTKMFHRYPDTILSLTCEPTPFSTWMQPGLPSQLSNMYNEAEGDKGSLASI